MRHEDFPKVYKLSDEIVDILSEAKANEQCRDSCISNLFGWKRAAYFSTQAQKLHGKAWQAVYALYPELRNQNFSYNYDKQELRGPDLTGTALDRQES